MSLKKLDYLSRSQLQRIHRLGGDRNARRVIQNMSHYLCSFREGENIYYLNQEGRERVSSKKVRKKTLQARHFLMRNDVYIAYNQPATWKNEVRIKAGDDLVLIADAMFERSGRYYFVEVDHTQKMNQNRSKIEKYKKIKQNNDFTLIWITLTEYRRKQLISLCEGLDAQVHTINDFK